MWRSINLLVIIGGGILLTPSALEGFGTSSEPPGVGFILTISVFALFSGCAMAYFDAEIRGNQWVRPSISLSPFGEGKMLQQMYLSSLCVISLGISCAIFGRGLGSIEWMGLAPLLWGAGILVAVMDAGKTFKDNFLD